MDYTIQRRNMVDCQLRPNRVTDERILAAMGELPREQFLPKARRGIAYVDEATPIAPGRYLTEPMVLGRLIETAAVKPTDVALLIGCGTGYAAAVLARVASVVVALESDPQLAAEATRTLASLGIDTVSVVEGPLARGYPEQSPYDVILFDGAVPEIPAAVADQLAEGGRLMAVIAAPLRPNPLATVPGKAVLAMRVGETVSRREVFDAGTPPLPGFEKKRGFVFA